jgi:prophage regulatory protein
MAPAPDRMLRLKAVLERTGLSRSSLYRRIADGSFPHQVQLGPRSTGWRESAIQHWIADTSAYADIMRAGSSAPASSSAAVPAQ